MNNVEDLSEEEADNDVLQMLLHVKKKRTGNNIIFNWWKFEAVSAA